MAQTVARAAALASVLFLASVAAEADDAAMPQVMNRRGADGPEDAVLSSTSDCSSGPCSTTSPLCEELSDGRLDHLGGGVFDGNEIAMVACNMVANMLSNGTILASPSKGNMVIHEYPDGTSINENDYYYMWQRDAGLAMRTLLRVAPRDGQRVRQQLEAYVALVHKMWSTPTTNENCAPWTGDGWCSILGEPKFFVNGSVYSGPWGRAQNDGPAINAMVLMGYLEMLEREGHTESSSSAYRDAKADIIIALTYVGGPGQGSTIDPWEMLYGQHFFVQSIQYRAMVDGAAMAEARGWQDVSNFSLWGSMLQNSGREHWDVDTQVVVETIARPWYHEVGPKCTSTSEPGANYSSSRIPPCELDVATLLGSLASHADQGHHSTVEPVIAPYDIKMLRTVRQFVDAMGPTYEVNQLDDAAGLPGVLIGRYPGDEYSGVIMSPANATPVCEGWNCGSAWFLATHALAEVLFILAGAIMKFEESIFSTDMLDFLEWACDLGLKAEERGRHSLPRELTRDDLFEVGNRLLGAGDGVLKRAKSHAGPGLHMSEQIYRGNGKLPGVAPGAMIGARDLTWSYASLLDAVAARSEALQALTQAADAGALSRSEP